MMRYKCTIMCIHSWSQLKYTFYISNSNGLLENVVERKLLMDNGVVISDFGEYKCIFLRKQIIFSVCKKIASVP